MNNQALKKEIMGRQEEILEAIQGAIRIPSVGGPAVEDAPYGEGPKRALEYALKLGEEMGFKVKNIDNHAGYAEYGEGEEMVAVLAHLDVVPEGEGWTHDPFGGEIEDGFLYGRGVADDKGMAIGSLYALNAIKDLKLPLDRRIRILWGTNEERGSKGIQHYIDRGEEIPVMGFTPDASYPMIFFEKGMTRAELGIPAPRQGAVEVLGLTGGTATNIVPHHCRLVLEGQHEIPEAEGIRSEYKEGRTLIETTGQSVHGSTPALGKNAIVMLMEAVQRIGIGGSFQRICDFIVDRISGEPNGEKLGIRFQDEETGETTLNLGTIDWRDGKISMQLDIRYPKNGSHEAVGEALEKAAADYGLTVLERVTTDSLYIPKDSELIQKLMAVYEEETGLDPAPLAIGGGTYAKMFPHMCGFGPLFPGDPDVDHQPDERLEVQKLMQAIVISGQAMLSLARY